MYILADFKLIHCVVYYRSLGSREITRGFSTSRLMHGHRDKNVICKRGEVMTQSMRHNGSPYMLHHASDCYPALYMSSVINRIIKLIASSNWLIDYIYYDKSLSAFNAGDNETHGDIHSKTQRHNQLYIQYQHKTFYDVNLSVYISFHSPVTPQEMIKHTQSWTHHRPVVS